MTRAVLVTVAWLMTSLPAAQPLPPGFSRYLVGFMTRSTGAATTSSPELQKAHLANLTKMWQEDLLVASGPIGGGGDLRGFLILRDDRAAIEKRLADDPLVSAGLLKVALKPWMGPSDIGLEYKKWAAANPGAPDKMRTYQLALMRPAPGAAPMSPTEQTEHLKAMAVMANSGKLAAAGPILEPGDLTGIFVFDTPAAEAEALASSDPGVKAGKFTIERVAWHVAEGVIPKGFKVPVR